MRYWQRRQPQGLRHQQQQHQRPLATASVVMGVSAGAGEAGQIASIPDHSGEASAASQVPVSQLEDTKMLMATAAHDRAASEEFYMYKFKVGGIASSLTGPGGPVRSCALKGSNMRGSIAAVSLERNIAWLRPAFEIMLLLLLR